MKSLARYTLMLSFAMMAFVSSCGKSAQVTAPHEELSPTSSPEPMTFQEFQEHRSEIVLLPLDIMGSLADKTIKAHPHASQNELRRAFWEELHSVKLGLDQGRISATITKPSTERLGITWYEAWLLTVYPQYAPATAYAVSRAEAEAAKRWPNMSDQNTRQDAFRHSFWNILLCMYCGEWWAERYTTAHEGGSASQSSLMDLNNNAVGRMLYRNNRGHTESWYSDYVRSYRYLYLPTINMSSTYLLFFAW